MLNIQQVGQELRAHLAASQWNEALHAAALLLSAKNGAPRDYLQIADILVAAGQHDLGLELGRKGFLTNPFDGAFPGWLAASGLPPHHRDLLGTYAAASRPHFEAVLSAIAPNGPLIFVDLGSSAADHFEIPGWLADKCHLVSLDGLSVPDNAAVTTHRTALKSIVGGRAEPATFYEKHWLPASSLLPDKPEIVAAFGMEQFAAVKTAHPVTTQTLEKLLGEIGITRIDALKTDLEGIDLAVLQSVGHLLPSLTFLRMELAFLPRYQGEPQFHEAHQYLTERKFSLMGMKPEYWRYKTQHRDYSARGRMVWGDFDYLAAWNAGADINAQVRYLLVAAISGQSNYAEYLIENEFEKAHADMAQSLKFALFAETTLLKAAHANPQFPHIGTA